MSKGILKASLVHAVTCGGQPIDKSECTGKSWSGEVRQSKRWKNSSIAEFNWYTENDGVSLHHVIRDCTSVTWPRWIDSAGIAYLAYLLLQQKPEPSVLRKLDSCTLQEWRWAGGSRRNLYGEDATNTMPALTYGRTAKVLRTSSKKEYSIASCIVVGPIHRDLAEISNWVL